MIYLLKIIKTNIIKLDWTIFIIILLIHSSISWFLMFIANEKVAMNITDWTYFYIVTATTVGYGDFSPETDFAKWSSTLWIIPGSIGIFAVLIGKITTKLALIWRKKMNGSENYENKKEHTVILGWHGELTKKMIDILYKDKNIKGDIVLCVIKDIENPMPDKVFFVKGESFTDKELLIRSGIKTAKRIIIYSESDEQAISTTISVHSIHPTAHIVVYCEKNETAEMLGRIIKNIECVQNSAIEKLIRSAIDPGVSKVINELLSLNDKPAQYTTKLKKGFKEKSYKNLLMDIYNKMDVTLIGYIDLNGEVLLNPYKNDILKEDMFIVYISKDRILSEDLI